MADGKRLSVNAKVAVPKVGGNNPNSGGGGAGQPLPDLDVALGKAIGARLRINTSGGPSDNTIEGTLYTACPVTNLVAVKLAASATTNAGSYKILPISHIQNFTLLSTPNGVAAADADATVNLAPLDFNALRRREEEAVRKAKEKDALRGRGVDQDAQDLFDYVHARLPSRWHETDIIVNDAVIISAPYKSENCKVAQGKQGSLGQVRKTLDAYHTRKLVGSSGAGNGRAGSPAVAGTNDTAPGAPKGPPKKGG